MRRNAYIIVATILCCLALANALTYFENNIGKQRAIIDDKVTKVPSQWYQIKRAEKNYKKDVIIALKQRNRDVLEKIFWEVSDPTSPKYGKFLSIEQITEIVRPADFTIKSVVNWVEEHGIDNYRFNANEDFLHFSADVETLETMFETEFHLYQHSETGKFHVTSIKRYSVPIHLGHLLDFATGFTGFPLEKTIPKTALFQSSDPTIGPVELRQRYNVTGFGGTNSKNKQAVTQFEGDWFGPNDLELFIKQYYPQNTNQTWWTIIMKGENYPFNPWPDTTVKVQYIKGIAPGVPTYMYSIPSTDIWGDLTNWTSALSSDPDPPYVNVVSISSTVSGLTPTEGFRVRLDGEFQKLGVRGLSLIFSSGDYGTGCSLCFYFEPSYPGTSIYVTAVGATHFTNGAVGPESAVTAYSSGGGMSWDFDLPSYQQSAVKSYLSSGVSLPESWFYNGGGRAIPDVSALGIGYNVIMKSKTSPVGSTAASTATFAGIISLLNEERFNQGKQPLGFLNPWIYQTAAKYPGAFYDVTQGSNQYSCCGTQGFLCTKGWDPVTGVGTPNYQMLKNLV